MDNLNLSKIYSFMVGEVSGRDTSLETANFIYENTKDWTLEEMHMLHCIMLQAHQSKVWRQMREYIEGAKQ